MKKIISFVGLFAVMGAGIGDAHGVAMSAQVRRLLQEKQEKIEQLEKCEGKKQGWMIAGISTIGLTAVGVGVNIAQASKSNRLSNEIEMEKSTLERHQDELNRIQNDIAVEQAKKAKDEQQTQKDGNNLPKYIPAGGGKYDDYKLTCDTVRFTFDKVDDYSVVLANLNAECQRVMKKNMVNLTEFGLGDSDASKVVFECSGYKESITCESNGGIVLKGGVIGQPCAESIEDITNSKFTGVWTRDDKGQYTCHATANDNLPIPCVCGPEQKSQNGSSPKKLESKSKIENKNQNTVSKNMIGDPCSPDKVPEGATGATLTESMNGKEVCYDKKGKEQKCYCKPDGCKEGYENLVDNDCTKINKYQIPSYGLGDYYESRASTKTETNKDGYCYKELDGTEFNEICNVNQYGAWGAVFNGKNVYGVSRCSVVEGSFGDSKSINDSEVGMYCYCKLASGRKWINVDQTTSCGESCAYHCAYQFYSNESFRGYF